MNELPSVFADWATKILFFTAILGILIFTINIVRLLVNDPYDLVESNSCRRGMLSGLLLLMTSIGMISVFAATQKNEEAMNDDSLIISSEVEDTNNGINDINNSLENLNKDVDNIDNHLNNIDKKIDELYRNDEELKDHQEVMDDKIQDLESKNAPVYENKPSKNIASRNWETISGFLLGSDREEK